MRSLKEILLAVRHPFRAYQHVKRLEREKETDNFHSLRIGEYEKSVAHPNSAIMLVTKADSDLIEKLKVEIRDKRIRELIEAKRSSIRHHPHYERSGLPHEIAEILYVCCRILEPANVIETGVAYGISSYYILEALRENGRGSLYSIDLLPVDTQQSSLVGALVPDELKDRWIFIEGDSMERLPTLLGKLGAVDIFLHDSEHSYVHMHSEFEGAWAHLKPGGLLMADNVERNDAFIDFCEKKGTNPITVKVPYYGMIKPYFGMIRKPSNEPI